MALINNWDLKEVNNDIFMEGGEPPYEVSDLGASLGRTGNSFARSQGVMKDYAETKFIEKVTPEYVDFVMHSRPFFITIVNVPNYRFRTRMESVTKHIPVADARWVGNSSASFPPNRSATASVPPAFRPPRSTAIPGS